MIAAWVPVFLGVVFGGFFLVLGAVGVPFLWRIPLSIGGVLWVIYMITGHL